MRGSLARGTRSAPAGAEIATEYNTGKTTAVVVASRHLQLSQEYLFDGVVGRGRGSRCSKALFRGGNAGGIPTRTRVSKQLLKLFKILPDRDRGRGQRAGQGTCTVVTLGGGSIVG